MRIEHQKVNIDKLIEHWVKDYEFKEGESLCKYNFYYDPNKGMVVFELFINEAGKQ